MNLGWERDISIQTIEANNSDREILEEETLTSSIVRDFSTYGERDLGVWVYMVCMKKDICFSTAREALAGVA